MQRPGLVSFTLVICLQFALGYAEEVAASTNSEASHEASLNRAKRGSFGMLRLGRGLHMLRLGKRSDEPTVQDDDELENTLAWLQEYNENYPYNLDSYDDFYPEEDVELPNGRYKRSTSAVNTPVSSEPQVNSAQKEIVPVDVKGTIEEEPNGNEKVYFYDDLEDETFQPQEVEDDEEKRSLGMLRLGKRSLGMLRLGKREAEDEEDKRSFGMLRLGKRQLSMLRLGKRSLGMLRLGKRQDENVDGVYSEEEEESTEKRPMSMLRLGKRPMSMLRLGKRPMSMLRLGKRPMSMLRLGKRPMSMLRLGKRPMSMLRLGKRPMSMLRLGKRPMSMLRLGKRPMSMLRLGKREEEDKKSLGMLRLGKRSTQ